MGVPRLVLLLGLAGCDHLLQLDPIPTPDAAPDAHAACPGSTTLPDEDGDGCPDVSDDCPGVFDPMQDDGDGDGVGDACDPHPTVAGDAIAFSAFFDNGPDARWTLDNPGDWTTSPGQITNSGTVDVRLTHTDMPIYPSMEIGYHPNDAGQLRVEFQNTSVYVACHVDWNPPNEYDLFLDGIAGATSAAPVLRVTMTSDAVGSTCSLLGSPVTDANAMSTEPPAATIIVQGGQVIDLHYIIVYSTMP